MEKVVPTKPGYREDQTEEPRKLLGKHPVATAIFGLVVGFAIGAYSYIDVAKVKDQADICAVVKTLKDMAAVVALEMAAGEKTDKRINVDAHLYYYMAGCYTQMAVYAITHPYEFKRNGEKLTSPRQME